MYHTRVTARFEDGTPIDLVQVAAGSLRFGAGRIYVRLGGTPLDGPEPTFAVMAWTDQVRGHINVRDECRKKLVDWGLNPLAADLLLDVAELSAAAPVPSLPEQEAAGGVDEEIEKLVDGVVEDIRNGHVAGKRLAKASLFAAVRESTYAFEYDRIAEVLRHVAGPGGLLVFRTVAADTLYTQTLLAIAQRPEYQNLEKA